MCYLQRCWLLVHWSDEDHQLVVDAEVAKDVTLRHRDMKAQDLQDGVDDHRLVLIQLETEVKGQTEGVGSDGRMFFCPAPKVKT